MRKEQKSDCERAFQEYGAIATVPPDDSYTIFTDGSVYPAEFGEPRTCGAGYLIMKRGMKSIRGQKQLGDNDINVGEISAIFSAIKRLQSERGQTDLESTQVHIFTDSNETFNFLTTPGKISKYYN